MPATVKKTTPTQYRLDIELSKSKTIFVQLDTAFFLGEWDLVIFEERLTIREIIDVCDAVYETGLIKEDEGFGISYKGCEDKVRINGRYRITDDVLKGFSIPFGGKK